MSLRILGQLEDEAHIILFMFFVIILFWHSVWGIVDELENMAKEKYDMPRVHFNILTAIFVLVLIYFFPKILHML